MTQVRSILENVLYEFEKNSAIVGSFLLVLLSHSFWGKIADMFEDIQAAPRGLHMMRNSPPAHSHLSEQAMLELFPPAPLEPSEDCSPG